MNITIKTAIGDISFPRNAEWETPCTVTTSKLIASYLDSASYFMRPPYTPSFASPQEIYFAMLCFPLSFYLDMDEDKRLYTGESKEDLRFVFTGTLDGDEWERHFEFYCNDWNEQTFPVVTPQIELKTPISPAELYAKGFKVEYTWLEGNDIYVWDTDLQAWLPSRSPLRPINKE